MHQECDKTKITSTNFSQVFYAETGLAFQFDILDVQSLNIFAIHYDMAFCTSLEL